MDDKLYPNLSQRQRSDWRPAIAMVLLATQIALLVGTWFLFFATQQYSGRQLHVAVILLVIVCSAIAAFVIDYLWRRGLASDVTVARDRLHTAMIAGKSVGWEWNIATGQDRWFGNLQTIFGIPSDTYTGQVGDFFRYVHPEDRQRVSEAMTNSRIHRQPYEAQFRVIRPDGAIRWVASRGSFYYSKSGSPERMLGMAVDVTDRHKVEEALLESEERFRRVVEHIGDAVIVDNIAGDIVFANDRFLQLFGFSREQLPSVKIEDYVTPGFSVIMRNRHNRRMQGEAESTHFQYQGIRADGVQIWLEADVVPIVDQSGKVIGTQSAIRDITDRKNAEHALQESEERFRLVANNAPAMIWISGPDKLCTYFNQRWLEFTGRPLQAELGNGWADRVHSEDFQHCLDTYKQAFDRREPFEMQYRLQRHDGHYRWLKDIGVPRFNSDKSFAGYIGSCIDITEAKLGEEALASIGRRLIEAHEKERTWIARELHDDINQRIALLAVELEQWKQDVPELTPNFEFHLQQIRNRLFDIAKDVQSLSHRLHSSKLEFLGLAVAANSFCHELAEQHKVHISFAQSEVPAKLPTEISLALFRVLQEALHNAVKHSAAHQFSVHLCGRTDEIFLAVTDAGRGFNPAEAMNQNGLGLVSMRERLQLVGGRLAIDSSPGRGTTVQAYVPLPTETQEISIAS